MVAHNRFVKYICKIFSVPHIFTTNAVGGELLLKKCLGHLSDKVPIIIMLEIKCNRPIDRSKVSTIMCTLIYAWV